MTSTAAVIALPGVRTRAEYFGALAWTQPPRRIMRLGRAAAVALTLHRAARPAGAVIPDVPGGIPAADWQHAVAELEQNGLLIPAAGPAVPVTAGSITVAVRDLDRETPPTQVMKPLWVHIQPFTRCNQHCIHCYCNGGPKADPFLFPVATWQKIIALLDAYGVLDVYVTGGESLLYDEFFTLAEDILDRGMGFGVSTNATVLSPRVLGRLRALRIETVQVSLDGAYPDVHELIRGAPGSFARTCAGIQKIAEFASPVINTVVSHVNLRELDAIVALGKQHGCSRFKFFPQKPVGRARSGAGLTLSDDEIIQHLIPECARLAGTHGVQIETIDQAAPCGSGSVGFALDQNADMYPCIFGVADPAQRCGNILTGDLDELWFSSPVLARFRGQVSAPCRRCEP